MPLHPLRILVIATAIEACLFSGLLAVIGLGGAFEGWLDVVNAAAPLLLPTGAIGALATWITLAPGRWRAACLILGGGAAVYAAAMIAPDIVGPKPHGDPAGRATYRVVSANVFRENVSTRAAASDVTGSMADALLLQEMDTVGETARSRAVLDRYYPVASDCPGSTVQIRLKTPILAQGCGLIPGPIVYGSWENAFVWVRVAGPAGRPIVLATVHFQRPYPPQKQALERQLLAQAIDKLPQGDPVILTGDFNTVPWSFGMRTQDRLLAPLRRWTRLRATYPAQINMTWTPWRWPVLPIDHVYASPAWTCLAIERFRVSHSDHFGLLAQFRLAPAS